MKLPIYKRFARLSPSLTLFIVTGLLILASLVFSGIATAMRPTGIAAAWERARDAGAYRFSADIRQTTTPLATVRNVGRASKTQTLHLEGDTNLPDRALHLTLWSQGGNVLTGAGGVEIKVEGDRAYARQGGQDWQEINNFTGLFAPQGDFMAFLAAAKNVQRQDAPSEITSYASRFTFDIDGPAYAAYLRDQMEKQLAASGELPPGVTLDVPKQYVDMTGDGELWLDANGYPRRQILRIHFPPTPDSQMISAEVTVDFDFSVPGAADLTSPVARFAAHLPRIAGYGSRLALVIALCAMLVIHSRSRKLYTVLAVFLVAATIFTPLLQSVQAAEFAEKQAALQREAEARQQESDMQRTLSGFLGESDHDPHLDPLAANRRVGESVNHESYFTDYAIHNMEHATLATSATSDNSDNDDNASDCDPDNPADTDGDGLTDGNECVLGTNPEADDTDGDGISDGDEVRGFDYNGQTWYTDPLALDTNNDGLGDGQEWNAGRAEGGPPPDLDGDGTPDLFDRDNDGDGVPDKLDLSPYYRGDATFTDDDPFELIVDDLEPGVPTFVEFQLRPTNPDHLWYAFNVLDWPKGDLRGQIQDKDGATFYDVDGGTDRNPNDNGDVKLVPMLEIRITGSPDNLPPEDDLEPYGIFVVDLNDDGDKAVYVPLQLITERTGEEHVAFRGKMRYLPAEEGWGNAQQVRLVWMVQALVDVCEKYKDGSCVKYEERNRIQIIHTYGDEWFLTGLDVREDHGVDFAVIYEDPAVDDDLDDDSLLLYLTYGLEKTFLAGSDCEDLDDKGTSDPNDDECIAGDGQRDITIAEIYRRWNHATNSTISDIQRWSLDNHLSVVTHTYETMDEGMATLAMTDTKQILDDHFTAYTPVTPTLLFAREERFRGANLDQSLDEDSGVVQWSTQNPRRLTMRLAEDETPLETVAGLNWAPYRYQGGEWEAYPIEEYWDELHDRYAAAFANEYNDADDPEAARGGAVIVGQMYYLTLYVGVSQVVQSGDDLLIQEQVQSGDTPIWASIADFGKAAVLFVVNEVIMSNFEDATSALRALYRTAWRGLKNVRQWWAGFKARLGAIAMATLVTLALVVTAISFLFRSYLNHHPAVRGTTAFLVGVGLFVGTVVQPILQAINLIKAISAVEGLSTLAATGKVLKMSSKLIGVSKAISVIGTIISVAIAWGVFIYTVITEDVPVNSVTFDVNLAQTIAATIVAILMLALSLTIIGAIIVNIIQVIDIFLTLLGFEWTITGWVTDTIAKAIFSYEPVIDVDDEDLVAMGGLDTALVRPGDGMVDGAELEFSTILTTTITHQNPRNWRTRAYLWMYDKDQLRSTTFKYELSSRKVSLSAKLGEISDDWHIGRDHKFWGHQMYTGWKSDSLSTITTLQAGINSRAKLKLTTAWAVPAMDCWTLGFLPPHPYLLRKGHDRLQVPNRRPHRPRRAAPHAGRVRGRGLLGRRYGLPRCRRRRPAGPVLRRQRPRRHHLGHRRRWPVRCLGTGYERQTRRRGRPVLRPAQPRYRRRRPGRRPGGPPGHQPQQPRYRRRRPDRRRRGHRRLDLHLCRGQEPAHLQRPPHRRWGRRRHG